MLPWTFFRHAQLGGDPITVYLTWPEELGNITVERTYPDPAPTAIQPRQTRGQTSKMHFPHTDIFNSV